ncbi:hypothetical protein [Mucilaginibacter flavus]|uniref:hypothetical protein n=1 Tax=Mucilaginibacter flavus TaxID=931504 RepID=UPI0025B4DFFB|nr:hypothetical protein [Mucilaginibacter flavus]
MKNPYRSNYQCSATGRGYTYALGTALAIATALFMASSVLIPACVLTRLLAWAELLLIFLGPCVVGILEIRRKYL